MNSESVRKSSKEMKEAQKEMLDRAKQAQPAVVLTDANWKALISSQEDQINVLAQLLDMVYTLADRQDLVDWVNQELEYFQNETTEREKV